MQQIAALQWLRPSESIQCTVIHSYVCAVHTSAVVDAESECSKASLTFFTISSYALSKYWVNYFLSGICAADIWFISFLKAGNSTVDKGKESLTT